MLIPDLEEHFLTAASCISCCIEGYVLHLHREHKPLFPTDGDQDVFKLAVKELCKEAMSEYMTAAATASFDRSAHPLDRPIPLPTTTRGTTLPATSTTTFTGPPLHTATRATIRGSATRGSPTRGSATRGSPTRGSPTRGSPTRGSPTRGSPLHMPLVSGTLASSSGKASGNVVPTPFEAASAMEAGLCCHHRRAISGESNVASNLSHDVPIKRTTTIYDEIASIANELRMLKLEHVNLTLSIQILLDGHLTSTGGDVIGSALSDSKSPIKTESELLRELSNEDTEKSL